MSICTLSKADSVLWAFLYADCIFSCKPFSDMYVNRRRTTTFSRILDRKVKFDTGRWSSG